MYHYGDVDDDDNDKRIKILLMPMIKKTKMVLIMTRMVIMMTRMLVMMTKMKMLFFREKLTRASFVDSITSSAELQ